MTEDELRADLESLAVGGREDREATAELVLAELKRREVDPPPIPAPVNEKTLSEVMLELHGCEGTPPPKPKAKRKKPAVTIPEARERWYVGQRVIWDHSWGDKPRTRTGAVVQVEVGTVAWVQPDDAKKNRANWEHFGWNTTILREEEA